jgi:hypothetical protein
MHCALPFCSTSDNVVTLEELLGAYGSLFRVAVQKILVDEGFELGSGLPNLQLAREIQDSIGWFLEDQGFETDWESLQLFLEWADRQGILLDLSLDPELSLLAGTQTAVAC